jgi:uncharacterized membrane protein
MAQAAATDRSCPNDLDLASSRLPRALSGVSPVVWLDFPERRDPVRTEHPAIERRPAAAIAARRQAAATGWRQLHALRAGLVATAEHERAIDRRRRAAASAGGTITILAALSLLVASLLATTSSGNHLLASLHHAAAPGLSFEHARRLLIVATALTIVTASTWLMLVVVKPAGERQRQPRSRSPRPRPASRVQRHRVTIVLAAGVTPVLLGGGIPFAAKFLPIGLHIDTNSAVGSSLLDIVIGFAVPATILSVLFFRWMGRLAGMATDASESPPAATPARAPLASDPTHV